MYGLQEARQYGHVIQDAEPHGLVMLGMVAGWANEGKSIGYFLVDHALRQRNSCPCRFEGNVIGFFADSDIQAVQESASAGASLPGAGQVSGGMIGLYEFLLDRQGFIMFSVRRTRAGHSGAPS